MLWENVLLHLTYLSKFFSHVNNVYIVSDNGFYVQHQNFTQVMCLYCNITDVNNGVLIHLNKTKIKNILEKVFWNPRSKIFVLSHVDDNITDIFRNYDFCEFVIFNGSNIIDGTIWRPKFCPDWKPKITQKPPEPHPSLNQVNVTGCVMPIGYGNLEPFVLFYNNTMKGSHGICLENIGRKLGFVGNYTYYSPPLIGWARPTPFGLLGDVYLRRMIIGFGGFIPYAERYPFFDFVSFMLDEGVGFAVPLGSGHSQITWFKILVSEFDVTLWIALMISFLVLSVAIFAFHRIHDSIFQTFGFIIGIPQTITKGRTLAVTSIWFGLIITSAYKSSMSSKLTAPSKIPNIDTLIELADSGLKLLGIVNIEIILSGMNSTIGERLHNHFEITNRSFADDLEDIVLHRRAACLIQKSVLRFEAMKRETTRHKVHIVEQPAFIFKPVMFLPKHSCFTPILQNLIIHFNEAGLLEKWRNDIFGDKLTGTRPGPRSVTLNDILGMFYLIITGWVVSFFVFICEYFCLRLSKRSNVKVQ